MPPARRPFGLCAYGVPYLCGFAGRGTPQANPAPLDVFGLLELAAKHHLSWLEVPPVFVPPSREEEFVEAAAAAGLELVVAGPRISEVPLDEAIAFAARVGAKVVRCTATGVLCGDRATHAEGWRELCRGIARTLREAGCRARDLGLRIGVENHQDLTSEELVHIVELAGPHVVGITLDTGNPMAVAEEPMEFYETVLPYVVDVHLKDYHLFPCEDGFRLVHCAVGDGVVPFGSLFELLEKYPDVPRSIEMAAMGERHIKWLTPAWWHGYGPRDARRVVPFVRFVQAHGQDGDWRTPWDRGETEGLAEWELARYEQSVRNMADLVG